jgi:hypothetical protein
VLSDPEGNEFDLNCNAVAMTDPEGNEFDLNCNAVAMTGSRPRCSWLRR